MKKTSPNPVAPPPSPAAQNTCEQAGATELLLLADGRLLIHNLTPAFAQVLRQLNPQDSQLRRRARPAQPPHAS